MRGPLTKISVDRNRIDIYWSHNCHLPPTYVGPVHWFGIVLCLVELLCVSLLLSFAFRLFALFLTSLGFLWLFPIRPPFVCIADTFIIAICNIWWQSHRP